MYQHFKKIADYSLAAIGICAAAPIVLPIALGFAIQNKGDVFFTEKRLGKDGKPFNILKLKTMLDLKDSKGELLSEGERTTPFGKLIRKTGLDEAPQLINILRGEMSFVGPRPMSLWLIGEEKYKKNKDIRRRYQVKPGYFHPNLAVITKKINSLPERVKQDIEYIEKQSFSEDIKLIGYGLYEIATFQHDKYNLKEAALAKSIHL